MKYFQQINFENMEVISPAGGIRCKYVMNTVQCAGQD